MPGQLYRQLIKLLRDTGCHYVRPGKGSHEIWYSPLTKRHFVVPFDVSKRPTANAVLKQAGLPKAF
jgi:predicted RNA binding protein YcfA (HicA-like mRNA interferase family)